jgi:hypothetical protein
MFFNALLKLLENVDQRPLIRDVGAAESAAAQMVS